MIKKLLLPVLILACGLRANGQFNYTVKDTTTPYASLFGATSLNGSLIWDEENLTAPMPFTWTMNGNVTTNKFNLALAYSSVLADTNNLSSSNGFVFSDADIADRGTLLGAASLSPIRYTTVGTSPNRIFKAELANAGFWEEYDIHSTMSDSFNLQVWVYETTNVVELHYGPSKITYPGDYFGFSGSGGPLVGYAKDVDFDFGSAGNIYYLTGASTSTGLDTFVLPPTTMPNGLNAWPANGTVFRFTPKAGCATPVANFTAGTPSGKTVQYTYSGTTSPVDSLVWNFGDGQKLKVTTGFTAPVTHTYTTNGHYNVCVTVYNNCGNNTYCKPLALSIGNLSALGDIKVFPNPANNQLNIEGMQQGGKVIISSLVGQQLMSADINSTHQPLDITILPPGTYLLQLIGKDGACGSLKITKQ